MDINKLLELGLNRNEAKVYISLIKLGTSSAGEIIKETEFHRNIVYDNLDKLIDKGLVTFIIEGKRKIFQPTPPDMISRFLDKEEQMIKTKKQIAEVVKREISKLQAKSKKSKKIQEATMFRGVNGLRVLFKDTLNVGKDYYVFGAPESSVDIMSSIFWKNYNLKRIENRINVKMIFNDNLREWSKKIKNKYTYIKFLPKEFDPLSETMIYGDKTAIIIWTEKPIAILIQDRNLAENYGQYFRILWKQAKK